MASTLLEQTREAHEAIERLERFIVSDFKTEAVTHKERLAQNHRVNRALDEMASRAKRLRATYEDADGARKEEIAALGGGANVFAAFYDRLRESREYHRAYSGFHAADPEQTLVAPFRENVAIAFSGEEANGRYLDLHFAHRAFVNGAFGRKCEYISYLVDLGADGAFASSGGGKGGGDDADDTKTNNAMTPDRAKKFTRAYGEYLDELLAYLGAFCLTLVPIRSRRRGERRSLRTLPGASLRPPLAFNPRHRRLSTPTDAFQLHPDVRLYRTHLNRQSKYELSSILQNSSKSISPLPSSSKSSNMSSTSSSSYPVAVSASVSSFLHSVPLLLASYSTKMDLISGSFHTKRSRGGVERRQLALKGAEDGD